MEREELRTLWPENNHRPIWVREHRDAINEHCDLSEPVPDKGAFHVRQWLERFKGVVTKQLEPDADETEAEA